MRKLLCKLGFHKWIRLSDEWYCDRCDKYHDEIYIKHLKLK